MAEFNDYSQKGSVLMQQALKKYAEYLKESKVTASIRI